MLNFFSDEEHKHAKSFLELGIEGLDLVGTPFDPISTPIATIQVAKTGHELVKSYAATKGKKAEDSVDRLLNPFGSLMSRHHNHHKTKDDPVPVSAPPANASVPGDNHPSETTFPNWGGYEQIGNQLPHGFVPRLPTRDPEALQPTMNPNRNIQVNLDYMRHNLIQKQNTRNYPMETPELAIWNPEHPYDPPNNPPHLPYATESQPRPEHYLYNIPRDGQGVPITRFPTAIGCDVQAQDLFIGHNYGQSQHLNPVGQYPAERIHGNISNSLVYFLTFLDCFARRNASSRIFFTSARYSLASSINTTSPR